MWVPVGPCRATLGCPPQPYWPPKHPHVPPHLYGTHQPPWVPTSPPWVTLPVPPRGRVPIPAASCLSPSLCQSPAYTLVWTRQNHGTLPPGAVDFNGILTLRRVRPEDAGVYVCTGSNMLDMDEGTATLYVQGEPRHRGDGHPPPPDPGVMAPSVPRGQGDGQPPCPDTRVSGTVCAQTLR